jgi:hypothetical protein
MVEKNIKKHPCKLLILKDNFFEKMRFFERYIFYGRLIYRNGGHHITQQRLEGRVFSVIKKETIKDYYTRKLKITY